MQATRKTAEGKQAQSLQEKARKKDQAMFKATLKKKDEDDDSDWESVEEDYPHVRLEELLDNLTLDGGNEEAKQ